MKLIMSVALLAATLITAMLCVYAYLDTRATTGDEGYAEILTPGNTLVAGRYDRALMGQNGWVNIRVDVVWYGVHEYRLVLKLEIAVR